MLVLVSFVVSVESRVYSIRKLIRDMVIKVWLWKVINFFMMGDVVFCRFS